MPKSTFIHATTFPAIVGAVLESFRKDRGFDQASIAEKVGVTQSTWSRIENGSSALSLEQLRHAADAVRVPPSTILLQAEQAERHLKQQGFRVVPDRIDNPIANGLILLGAAALAALVIIALAKQH